MFGSFLHITDIDIDISANCNWVDTRWQQYSTHLYTNSIQNNTIDTNSTQNNTIDTNSTQNNTIDTNSTQNNTIDTNSTQNNTINNFVWKAFWDSNPEWSN